MNLLRGVLSGWVEMNFDDEVEERRDRRLRKSGQSLGDDGHSQGNDRNHQSNNYYGVDDGHQMNHHSRTVVVFWSDLDSKDENDDLPDNKKSLVDHELMKAGWDQDAHMFDRCQKVGYHI